MGSVDDEKNEHDSNGDSKPSGSGVAPSGGGAEEAAPESGRYVYVAPRRKRKRKSRPPVSDSDTGRSSSPGSGRSSSPGSGRSSSPGSGRSSSPGSDRSSSPGSGPQADAQREMLVKRQRERARQARQRIAAAEARRAAQRASEPPASEPPASEPPASEPPASEPPASEPPDKATSESKKRPESSSEARERKKREAREKLAAMERAAQERLERKRAARQSRPDGSEKQNDSAKAPADAKEAKSTKDTSSAESTPASTPTASSAKPATEETSASSPLRHESEAKAQEASVETAEETDKAPSKDAGDTAMATPSKPDTDSGSTARGTGDDSEEEQADEASKPSPPSDASADDTSEGAASSDIRSRFPFIELDGDAPIPPESNEVDRDLFSQFTHALTGGLFQSSLYASDHPQAQAALDNIYELFTKTMDAQRHALTYVYAHGHEGNDLLVEGFFVEPFKLSDALGAGTAQLIVPRLLRYFDRNNIHSMTLFRRLTKADLVQFVDTVIAAALKEIEDIAAALEERGVDNIRLTFQEDVVQTKRELHWRTQLALTRLSKDLHQIPLLKNASAEEIGRIKHQLIDDILRPIRSGEFLCDLLLNLDIIDEQLRENGVPDVATTVLERVHVSTAAGILKGLMQSIDRVKTYGIRERSERADLLEEAERLLKVVIKLVDGDERQEATDVVEELIETGSLLLEDLPTRLRGRMQQRLRARQMLLNAQVLATVFAVDMSDAQSKAALAMMDNIRKLAPELVAIGGLDFLANASIALQAVKDSDSVPRRVVLAIPEVLEATVIPELFDNLTKIFSDEEEPKERRQQVIGVLRMLGQTGTRAFVDAAMSEKRSVRRMAVDALRQVGEEAESAVLELLGNKALDSQLACELIEVLEDVGTERSAMAVEALLEHDEAKVRAATVSLFVKTRGEQCEEQLVAMLDDDANEVLVAVVEALGKLRSKHPSVLAMYKRVLNPVVRGKFSDRMRITACVAIARAGNIEIEEGTNAEQLLCAALGGPPRRIFFFYMPRSFLFSSQVNGLICRVLARLGGSMSEEILEDIGRRDKTGIASDAQKALRELKERRAKVLEAASDALGD